MLSLLEQLAIHITTQGALSSKELHGYIRTYNQTHQNDPASKRRLLECYLSHKRACDEVYTRLAPTQDVDRAILATLRMKPHRTASGVATITVITKPEVCSSNCLYCPCDVRMPKSYLFDEPACQRAEHHYFDPYLQVAIRLTMLQNMGHITDKVELIVLGGTWTDYPVEYQRWFIKELFCALNDSYERRQEVYRERMAYYETLGLTNDNDELSFITKDLQSAVSAGEMTFNQAIGELYHKNAAWKRVSGFQRATQEELSFAQKINEDADNRVVGLVVETQPDNITPKTARLLRELGCTKAQIGVQSLEQSILDANHRKIKIEAIQQAFEWLRLYGFKIHGHFMANLYTATPQRDKDSYKEFVLDKRFQPDEIKMYPCALIKGTALERLYTQNLWRPYTEDELLDLLIENTLVTPPFVRISRMIREFASHNITCGNKKVNLRELVERKAQQTKRPIKEIRYREISLDSADVKRLSLQCVSYETTVTHEQFLQWVTPEDKIAGFLRLSLPIQEVVHDRLEDLAIGLGEAMIREVHVYGSVAGLGATSQGAQHLGLGRQLIEEAAKRAYEAGYTKLNVISSIGTRNYYRHLGFKDKGLYQTLDLKGQSMIFKAQDDASTKGL